MRTYQIYRTLIVGTALLVAGGCYNAEEMIARASSGGNRGHSAEIDLGEYQVTLPRDRQDPVATTIHVGVALTVDSEDVLAVQERLDDAKPQLQHATMLELRKAPSGELLEPGLDSLHERIKQATSAFLTDDTPIQSVVFRSFAVYED